MQNPPKTHTHQFTTEGNDDSPTSSFPQPAEPAILQLLQQSLSSATKLHSQSMKHINAFSLGLSSVAFITRDLFSRSRLVNANEIRRLLGAEGEEICSATAANVNVPSSSRKGLQFQHLQLGSSSITTTPGIGEATTENFEEEEVFEITNVPRGSIVERKSLKEKFFSFFNQSLTQDDPTNDCVGKGESVRDSVQTWKLRKSVTIKLSESESSSILRNRLLRANSWSIVWPCAITSWATVLADGHNTNTAGSINGVLASSLIITKNKDSQHQSTTPTLVQTLPASGSKTEEASLFSNEFKMKEEMQLEFILKSLVAGGVAGMCAKTTVAPLDRMKILLQAHSKHYSHLGVFSGLRGIVEKERFIALYKGNGAQMVRIFPYAATQFTSFEMYKKCFGEDSHVARFAAGSAAGVTAVALTYPLDTIRARLAFQVTGEHVYSGIYSCALHIFREEGGVRALYRGFIPTVCGMIPYAGLSFYCFESFKYICMKYIPTQTCKTHSTNTGGLVLLLYAKLLCGGVAGAVAQTVSYPFDVTRRRMQLAMMDEKTKKFGMGMIPTLKLIYEENGVIRGLYRGMSINYLRAIPMVAVSFSTYELVKQTLSLDTGLPIKTG